MNPGRELDALVAEKVMGWTLDDAVSRHGVRLGRAPGAVGVGMVPAYSTDIAAAWTVLEHLRQRHYVIAIYAAQRDYIVAWRSDSEKPSRADTAPHAICLAALDALGAAVPA